MMMHCWMYDLRYVSAQCSPRRCRGASCRISFLRLPGDGLVPALRAWLEPLCRLPLLSLLLTVLLRCVLRVVESTAAFERCFWKVVMRGVFLSRQRTTKTSAARHPPPSAHPDHRRQVCLSHLRYLGFHPSAQNAESTREKV